MYCGVELKDHVVRHVVTDGCAVLCCTYALYMLCMYAVLYICCVVRYVVTVGCAV